MNLTKRHPVRHGRTSPYYFFELPAELMKKEGKEEAIALCLEHNMLYAIVDGTPRGVTPDMEKHLQRVCTSYVCQDGLRFSFGRPEPDKTGGINYKHLLGAILDGDERAISFARVAKNQEWKNIRTTRRV